MTYKKITTGGSFGPGGSFPDRCYFENCTFTAAVQFGDHCDFKNCTFVKCCPTAFSNQSRTGKHCRFFDCQLESVQVGQFAELYNTNKSGYLVVIQGILPNKNTKKTKGGDTEIKSETNCGQRVDSKEVKKDKKFWHCGKPKVEGYSDVKATINSCGCQK